MMITNTTTSMVRPSLTRFAAIVTAAGVAVLLCPTSCVCAQSISFCEGELGQENWACEALSPIPAQAYEGVDDFVTLPGSPDPSNPSKYQQIAGPPVSFDANTGARVSPDDGSGAAVFVLTEGAYFCMIAESDGEAALLDAPEGNFISSTTQFPSSTWLSESIEAILAPDTKLKYIVYSNAQWDHIGAAGLVYDHFAGDAPMIIASKRTRRELRMKDKRDPTTVFGNNRGVIIPKKLEEADYAHLAVGGLVLMLDKIHAHQDGDLVIYLDKNAPENSAQGIESSVLMIVNTVFPGWIPVYFGSLTRDFGGYYHTLGEIYEYDFDVLVSGHLTRLGTKADVQVKIDFYDDVLKGAQAGIAAASFPDVVAGTAVFTPGNSNEGNLWLLYNEFFERVMDTCVEYILDSASRGRDWPAELAGLDVTLRSQCWGVYAYVNDG